MFIKAFVGGHPPTLTSPANVADPWKTAVANAIRTQWKNDFIRKPCRITLTFELMPDRCDSTALFNLFKPTIDGVANAVFAPAAAGQPGPWSREDHWIFQLSATKKMAREPGVLIELGECVGDRELRRDATAEAFIPGSPPLWPGDQVGQQKVVDWRRRFQEYLAFPPLPEHTLLDVSFVFDVETTRIERCDLDNLCVPAAQGVALAAFRDLKFVPRIQCIVADKNAAEPGSCGIGVSVICAL